MEENVHVYLGLDFFQPDVQNYFEENIAMNLTTRKCQKQLFLL